MQLQFYKAVIRKSNGQIVNKIIDANSQTAAAQEASRYGRVIRTSLIRPSWFDEVLFSIMLWLPNWLTKWMPNNPDPGLSNRDRIEFLQTLSNMLVGYSLNDALSIMIQNFKGPIRITCRKMRNAVLSSKDPIDALREMGNRYMPGVTLAIIATNSKVDKLSNAFKEGLSFERDMARLQSGQVVKIIAAMAWFFGTMVMIIVSDLYGWSFMESVNYFALMPESGPSQDALTATRTWLQHSGTAATILLSAWFLFILIIGAGRDLNPSLVEKWILKIPVVKGAMLNRGNFLACYQINKLLSKGVPLAETLKHVRNELEKGVLKDDLGRALELINEGNPDWVDGFHSFSDLDRALLKSSNNQNEIADVFGAQSDQFMFAYEKSVMILTLAHWVFISIFMIILIGVLSMLMFLPMAGGFDMVNQL